MVCAALAAYPLSRFRSRLNRPFLLTILFATSLPITAIMVPVYALFVQVNLIDTMQGTIFFFAASQLPFAIWLMKNFMDGVPKELEEAAWTDGASSLPVAGPDRAAADGAGGGGGDGLLVRDDVGELLRPVHAAAYAGSDAGVR